MFFHSDSNYEPLLRLGFYVLVLIFTLAGGQVMLTINMLLGVTSLMLFLGYCFGSLLFVSFDANAPYEANDFYLYLAANAPYITYAVNMPFNDSDFWYIGSMSGLLTTLPFASCGFAGVKSVVLLTSVANDLKTDITSGLMAAVVTLFAVFVFLSFVEYPFLLAWPILSTKALSRILVTRTYSTVRTKLR